MVTCGVEKLILVTGNMKHLKTFESFSINETMDMMTLPVDPISGSIDVYSEVFKSIGNKINDIVNPLKRVALSDVVKIKGFMIKTFGTTSPKLSKENAEKLNKVLGGLFCLVQW